MKTIILAINAKYEHTSLAPWYLKAAVREKRIREPEVIETHINQTEDNILENIREASPDALAISCYIWNITLVKKLIARISRDLPECVVILGGPEVSYNSHELMAELAMVDFIISGESEKPFADLLAILSRRDLAVSDARLEDIPRLTWREGKSIRHNGPELQAEAHAELAAEVRTDQAASAENEVQTPHAPYEHRKPHDPLDPLDPLEPSPYAPAYFQGLAGRIAYIEASRGCPFSCAFCLSGRNERPRYFNMERVKADLLRLAAGGAKTIKFVDRTINCHPVRFMELVRFIIDKRREGEIPGNACFHFEAAADLFDDASISLLRESVTGLFQLEIGLQSFNEATLIAINRVTDLEKACHNIALLRENDNIHIHLDLICGLPREDYRSFAYSFDRAYALAPHMLQLGFLKLLHGSRLREQAGEFGIEYDPVPPYQVRRTDWISAEELSDIALCADALNRLRNSGRFPATLPFLLGAASPFEFFVSLGRFTGDASSMPLEDYIQKLIDYYEISREADLEETSQNQEKDRGDLETLRDCLVMDWLATNRVGVLPVCLKKRDKENVRVKRILERAYERSKQTDNSARDMTRRPYGFGLLYGGGRTRVAIADYRAPRPPLKNYPLYIVNINEIGGFAFVV